MANVIKKTIIERLVQRGSPENGWEAQHIDVCINAFNTDIADKKVLTDKKSIDEVAIEIISLSDVSI